MFGKIINLSIVLFMLFVQHGVCQQYKLQRFNTRPNSIGFSPYENIEAKTSTPEPQTTPDHLEDLEKDPQIQFLFNQFLRQYYKSTTTATTPTTTTATTTTTTTQAPPVTTTSPKPNRQRLHIQPTRNNHRRRISHHNRMHSRYLTTSTTTPPTPLHQETSLQEDEQINNEHPSFPASPEIRETVTLQPNTVRPTLNEYHHSPSKASEEDDETTTVKSSRWYLDEENRRQAENARYEFASSIDDGINGNLHEREEVRDGLSVKGKYSYSDGYYKRTVYYEADDKGYRIVKESVKPLDGPEINPDGEANVKTYVAGNTLQYHITKHDIVKKDRILADNHLQHIKYVENR